MLHGQTPYFANPLIALIIIAALTWAGSPEIRSNPALGGVAVTYRSAVAVVKGEA